MKSFLKYCLLLLCFLLLIISVTYAKSLNKNVCKVTATAYCYIPKYSKWKNRIGTCAVDFKCIPYGSKVRFKVNGKTYNLTAIGKHGKRGWVIDIFLPTKKQCVEFGRKHIKVEIIKC